MSTRLFSFMGGGTGRWRVTAMHVIAGEPLPAAKRLDIVPSSGMLPEPQAAWVLRGITSHERYVDRAEKTKSWPSYWISGAPRQAVRH